MLDLWLQVASKTMYVRAWGCVYSERAIFRVCVCMGVDV